MEIDITSVVILLTYKSAFPILSSRKRKFSSTEFNNIFSIDIYTEKGKQSMDLMVFMTNPKVSIATISWDAHARVLYKDDHSKTVRILDPWRPTPNFLDYGIVKDIESYDYKYVETKRKTPDQPSHEGSCQVQTLMRMLMISRLGWEVGSTLVYEKGEHPEFLDYVVVTHNVMKKIRGGSAEYKYKNWDE